MCSSSTPALSAAAAAESRPLRNISIIVGGSRGDIQPYCAIALALERAGYSLRILTNEDHKPFVESFGLTHVQVFGNAEEGLKSDPLIMKSMAEGDAAAFFGFVAQWTKKEAQPTCERFHAEMEKNRPNLLIGGTMCEYFELCANVALGVPTLRIHLNALTREKRAPYGFPTLPFGLHNFVLFQILGASVVKSWEHYDDALEKLPGGMRVLSKMNMKMMGKEAHEPRLPILICKSESFRPILNPSAHSNYKFVGAAIVEKHYEIKHSSSFGEDDVFNVLEDFLSRDESRKPVYMGWGSMLCKSPEHMVLLATEALKESGQRGIILGGWAELSQELLEKSTTDDGLIEYARENVLFVEKAPHEWLLPRVSVAVHHGGAGTTNASMRAGIPTIVAPVFMDQYDQAYLVEQLGVGVGFSKQFQSISAKELAEAVSKVVDSNGTYQAAAKSIASKLREENGTEAVVKEVEQFWEENVATGKWQAVVKSLLKSSEPQTRNKLVPLALLGVIGAAVYAYCTKR